jgi:hypothetical protein
MVRADLLEQPWRLIGVKGKSASRTSLMNLSVEEENLAAIQDRSVRRQSFRADGKVKAHARDWTTEVRMGLIRPLQPPTCSKRIIR